ncbi:hypothetical protein SPRG_20034 [Saprolegnia parasitica CBS 223.65]|uniref:Uncharacterized protein n=1 Tax=Saprolegnia parasitica (strain CBS 223.65) TaxID=695850 RepID=A0A067CPU0_SAPPC|nr:hypothetical protein SPRG_20034 [Saprolegnia parasitica CBS 223.65]KDO28832.1 hypothetical protein SPRG_20034 [Saprolegnia parasitica CBS 223.65]|eukprot:XP_012200562.1 hypothetical protein SPRG_20034 [Saprolegnia parasitica CBS 223.65]
MSAPPPSDDDECKEGEKELYYWDASDEAPLTTKAWHWTYWSGQKVLEGMEFGGEVIATFLGLTRSKYDWILESKERDEQEKALRQLEARQRKKLQLQALLQDEKRKLAALEHGELQSETPESSSLLL